MTIKASVIQNYTSYAILKRYVLRLALKSCVSCAYFKSHGKSFHNLGAAIEKARSPQRFLFDFGTLKRSLQSEHNPILLSAKGSQLNPV